MLKKYFEKFKKYIFDEKYRFGINEYILHLYDRLGDKDYLKLKYRKLMHKELDLENPRVFNEKLQWLKLYNRNEKYTDLVDKYKVREYISQVLGEEYLIPLIGVYNDVKKIDFNKLPNQFVLKCNHNSGKGMIICRDKQNLDIKKTRKELKKGLKDNYYLLGREWPYKNVKRKIICEQFMQDNDNLIGLTDYKFFCFDGYVDCVMVCIDRHLKDTKFYFFDKNWNLKRINKRGLEAPNDFTLPKPKNIEKMFEIASKLSTGIPFVRVDLYDCNGKIYFGELTFYPDSGFDSNLLPETDEYFGKLIKLDKIK